MVCGNLTIDELVMNHRTSISPGGSAMFASAAAAKLGAKVGILGSVGEDYPPAIRRRLEKTGIDIKYLKKTTGPSTRFRITRFDGSRRLKLLEPGKSISLPPGLQSFQGIHLGPVFNEISSPLVRKLRKSSEILSADLQGFIRFSSKSGLIRTAHRNLDFLLAQCDIVQASLDEARSQTRSRDPRRILNRFLRLNVKHAIITMGKRGAWLGSREGEEYFVPAFPDRNVRDSTGAGDVFAGSWLRTFLSTADPVWASAVGAACASLASRRTGVSKFQFSKSECLRRAGWIYNKTRNVSMKEQDNS